jgi:hypothetical protein
MVPLGDRLQTTPGRCRWLVIWTCLILATRPAPAQNQPNAQVEELRRQLQAERAARKSLTYQADMRKAGRFAEVEDWSALRAVLDSYQPAECETDLRRWE